MRSGSRTDRGRRRGGSISDSGSLPERLAGGRRRGGAPTVSSNGGRGRRDRAGSAGLRSGRGRPAPDARSIPWLGLGLGLGLGLADLAAGSRAPIRVTVDASAAARPANIDGRADPRASVSSTVGGRADGDIAKNQRVMPTSNTAAVVNSIRGKRSISGYPQLIAMSLTPPKAEP